MKVEEFFKQPNEWMRGEGPDSLIVVSSRVRLARNLRGFAYPGRAKKEDRAKVLEILNEAFCQLPELKKAFAQSMDNLSPIDKQILVERHLISREHAVKGSGSGVIINDSETISVMINEEDHIRMQALRGGLALKTVFRAIDKLDSELEQIVDYDFSERFGYLTACPTNVGTGMRASSMLHLPGLVLAEQINPVIHAVNKLHLAVRGLYGEGTEAMGNLFQISNQTTLGEKEQDIVERLGKVINQIVEHETFARERLMETRPQMVADQIGRAFGILTNAHSLSSKEAMNLLSLIRLGLDLGMFQNLDRAVVDELFILTQPAHLQRSVEKKLSQDERDFHRAELVRKKLHKARRIEGNAQN
jgi:protein arginine kinase